MASCVLPTTANVRPPYLAAVFVLATTSLGGRKIRPNDPALNLENRIVWFVSKRLEILSNPFTALLGVFVAG
jgi:hypothetical protein